MKKEKMKVEKLLVSKNKQTGFLTGEVFINHYSLAKKSEI